MTMNKITQMLFCFTVIVAAVFIATTAHAVPAFSRAHKVECTTCHTIAPELNEYGDAFLKNSYVYVGKAKAGENKAAATAPVAAKKQPAGAAKETTLNVMGEGDADKLSKLKAGAMGAEGAEQAPAAAPAPVEDAAGDSATEPKAEGLVLAGIPEIIPVSFTGSINYAFGDEANIINGNKFDYATRSFKMHAAGNFRDKIGFYASYIAYSEQPQGDNTVFNTSEMPENNKTNIGELFIQARNFLGTPVNLKMGRMQPKLGLWKTNNKLSATNNYLPYTYTVGQESVFKVEQLQDVIELNSVIANRLFVAGGLVNRKGQNAKEGYGHISYKIGGSDYKGTESDVDLSKEESILDFLAFTLGTYGYFGENGSSVSGTLRNEYTRAGVDAELQYKIFRLRMLGGWGSDDNPRADSSTTTADFVLGPKVISQSGAVDAEVTIMINLIASARFEYLKQEANNVDFTDVRIRRYVGTLAYAPLENIKLSTEYKYEMTPTETNRIGFVGATFSF